MNYSALKGPDNTNHADHYEVTAEKCSFSILEGWFGGEAANAIRTVRFEFEKRIVLLEIPIKHSNNIFAL
jgi:hypothetical protein